MTAQVHFVKSPLAGPLPSTLSASRARRAMPRKLAAALLLAVWTLVPTTVLAQSGGGISTAEVDERPRPPTPGKKDSPTTLLYYGIAVVLLGLIVGANAIPAKRGHQD